MNVLETIELQSVGNNRKSLEQVLRSFIEELNIKTGPIQIKVYNNLAVDSNFSIHLLHNSSEVEINGSPLGLQLVSSLKEYGLINHSVWLEKNFK